MRDNKEKLKKIKITGKLIPEIKTKIAQAKKISNVCPISGCIINKRQAGRIEIKVSKYLK
jgi:predicted fused transcriptional regulator/phosphomethylpyrimidine kinase